MGGEVIYINNAKGGDATHITGGALCTNCGREWVGLLPIGEHELECPDCKTMKGVFKHHLAPVTNEVWQCNCGNKLFFLLKGDIQCIKCGDIAPKSEVWQG